MLRDDEARAILATAQELVAPVAVQEAVHRLAGEIRERLGLSHPLVLSVMGGAVVFTGHLLPLLDFPLDFDFIHASRYAGDTRGGGLAWRVQPPESCRDRAVLVLDDILDEGHTMVAIRERILALGARSFYCAVLADKDLGREKPIRADFVGFSVPDRYVFGFGMDVHGAWRNLPGIYAVGDR